MPKTFTDDVSPVLPSSIDGPFQVFDPGDHTSWIKIDPELGRIEAAGDARPVRTIVAPYLRAYSSVTPTFFGTVLPGNFVTAVTSGGFYAIPFPIPGDMDLTQPVRVRILITPLSDATSGGMVLRFTLAATHFKASEAPNESSVTYDWSPPTNWATTDPRLLLIDDGNGRTYAGNTFEQGDYLGLRIARLGATAEDTFDKSLKIADFLLFEYTAKEW